MLGSLGRHDLLLGKPRPHSRTLLTFLLWICNRLLQVDQASQNFWIWMLLESLLYCNLMLELAWKKCVIKRLLPVCIHLQSSVKEFLTYTVHCECPDPGSSIIQDDPLCQSVSNDGGYSSTSLRPCTTLTFPMSLPSRFLPRGRSTDNMAEFSLNAGCCEV